MIGMRTVRLGAAAIGAFVAGWTAWAAGAWLRYGRVDLARSPRDQLLDRFMPDAEVDEYHHIEVHAPASIVYDVMRHADLQAAPLVKQIFWLRELPGLLRGVRPSRTSHSLVDEVLANGYRVLAEIPGREIVIGTYTQPWHGAVVFHPLAPEDFADFRVPGNVKIAVVLGAEPIDYDTTRCYTRTRVVTTDAASRRKFRLYWGPFSAGIILIRYSVLPMVKRQAERRARLAPGGGTAAMPSPDEPAQHERHRPDLVSAVSSPAVEGASSAA